VSVAVGFVFGFSGFAVGMRARWNLLRTALTPLLGAGLALRAGHPLSVENTPDGTVVLARSEPALLLQAVAGLEWIASFGLTFLLEVGYALAASPAYSGELPQGLAETVQLQNGSTFMGGLAAGWTF